MKSTLTTLMLSLAAAVSLPAAVLLDSSSNSWTSTTGASRVVIGTDAALDPWLLPDASHNLTVDLGQSNHLRMLTYDANNPSFKAGEGAAALIAPATTGTWRRIAKAEDTSWVGTRAHALFTLCDEAGWYYHSQVTFRAGCSLASTGGQQFTLLSNTFSELQLFTKARYVRVSGGTVFLDVFVEPRTFYVPVRFSMLENILISGWSVHTTPWEDVTSTTPTAVTEYNLSNMNLLVGDSATRFTVAKGGAVRATGNLTVDGTLTTSGTVTMSGTANLSGALNSSGPLKVGSGTGLSTTTGTVDAVQVQANVLLASNIRLNNPDVAYVKTVSEFVTANTAKKKLIVLENDLVLTSTLNVDRVVNVEFLPGAMFRKGSSTAEIELDGSVPNRIQQFFGPGLDSSGNPTFEWNPGDIRGLIGGISRLPEWWGARAGYPEDNPATGADDTRAINCAVGAFANSSTGGLGGHTVLLGTGTYHISCPIVLSNTRCTLRGANSFGTNIKAWKNDSAPSGYKWTDHTTTYTRLNRGGEGSVFPKDKGIWFVDGVHVAMIYVGGSEGSGSFDNVLLAKRGKTTFACGVYDVGLSPLTQYANGGLRMSLISAREVPGIPVTKVEENTVLENINGSGYSGYGIGFANGVLLNGVTIRGFHMNGVDPGCNYAHCIYLPPITNAVTIENGTVGAGDHTDGGDPEADPPIPAKLDIVGIVAMGHCRISNVHIEHCHVGIDVLGTDGHTAVNISSMDYMTANPSWETGACAVRLRHHYSENTPPVRAALHATGLYSQNMHSNIAVLRVPGSPGVTAPSIIGSVHAGPVAFYTRGPNGAELGPIQ